MIAAFRRGVRFRCTRCGECCTRLSANLPLSARDVRRISAHLRMSVRSFVAAYGLHVVDRVRHRGGVIDIPSIELQVPASGTCVFLDSERQCAIQAVKPSGCARTPVGEYVAGGSPARWQGALSYWPGIGLGERYPRARIERLLREEMASEAAEIDAIVRSGGDLARLLRTQLPPPLVRETTTTGGERHGTSIPRTAPHPERSRPALDLPARRRRSDTVKGQGGSDAGRRRGPARRRRPPGATRLTG